MDSTLCASSRVADRIPKVPVEVRTVQAKLTDHLPIRENKEPTFGDGIGNGPAGHVGVDNGKRRRLRTHLEACRNCSAYLEQIRVTIRLSGSIEPEDLSPQAQDELTELYRRWLEGDN